MRLPEWATNAHNLFLEILFATGFIGFLMFLTLLVLVFSKQQPLNSKLMISFLLLGGFTESTIQFIYPVFTTYFFLALILARSEEVK
jgi:O-antigen ligase